MELIFVPVRQSKFCKPTGKLTLSRKCAKWEVVLTIRWKYNKPETSFSPRMALLKWCWKKRSKINYYGEKQIKNINFFFYLFKIHNGNIIMRVTIHVNIKRPKRQVQSYFAYLAALVPCKQTKFCDVISVIETD